VLLQTREHLLEIAMAADWKADAWQPTLRVDGACDALATETMQFLSDIINAPPVAGPPVHETRSTWGGVACGMPRGCFIPDRTVREIVTQKPNSRPAESIGHCGVMPENGPMTLARRENNALWKEAVDARR